MEKPLEYSVAPPGPVAGSLNQFNIPSKSLVFATSRKVMTPETEPPVGYGAAKNGHVPSLDNVAPWLTFVPSAKTPVKRIAPRELTARVPYPVPCGAVASGCAGSAGSNIVYEPTYIAGAWF